MLGVTTSGQLLLHPSVSELVDGGHKIGTEIARQVDWVSVEYGIDITPLLEERRRFHHLQEKVVANKASLNRPKRHRRGEASPVRQKRRRLQDNDYLILFGGDVAGDYHQSKFNAF
jgi:triacylglycerol esterase/lipase EstA (alpha/beta hydrolase family)